MKKIVVFFVLLALLSVAVFAQDDFEQNDSEQNGSGWTIGFTAQLSRDIFSYSKAEGNWNKTEFTNPTYNGVDGNYKGSVGKFTKGSSHLWTWTGENPWDHDTCRPDNRLIVSLSNNGEHHSVYIDAKLDNSWISGPSLMGLLNGGAADWSFSGDTGASGSPVVFDGKVGTGRYGGFVSPHEFWNDWIQSGDYNFFGVQRKDAWIISDNISNASVDGNPWSSVYALGASFGENFRLAIGSTLDSFNRGFNNPYASSSDIQGAFMFSGRNLGPIAFDLFYAVDGGDKNTVVRGTGLWNNLLGAYVGLDLMEDIGLGISLGYTANFKQRETGQELDVNKLVAFENEDPVWNGIDLKFRFSGVEKMDIFFNNNISFASVSGADFHTPGSKRMNGFDGDALDKGSFDNWVAYNAVLGTSYAITDNFSITLAVLNLLSVYKYTYITLESGSPTAPSDVTTRDGNKVSDELRGAITASYNVGNISFGLGFVIGYETTSSEANRKREKNTGYLETTTYKDNTSLIRMGVPMFFKVSI